MTDSGKKGAGPLGGMPENCRKNHPGRKSFQKKLRWIAHALRSKNETPTVTAIGLRKEVYERGKKKILCRHDLCVPGIHLWLKDGSQDSETVRKLRT